MTRWSRFLVVVGAIGAATVPGRTEVRPYGATAASQQPVFRTSVHVVSVPVSVTKGKQPVAGLVAADFRLLDGGVPQAVEVVPLDTMPTDVTVVMCGGFLHYGAEMRTGADIAEAIRRLLRPHERFRVVDCGENVQGALIPTGPSDQRGAPRPFRLIGGVSVRDALFYAIAWPVEPGRRHLVIAFAAGGVDHWSTLDSDRLPELARRSDAVVHVVQPGSPWSEPPGEGSTTRFNREGPTMVARMTSLEMGEWREAFGLLDRMVRDTGGLLHIAPGGADVFEQVLADFRSSYLLRYTPKGVAPSAWHELEVTVARPGSFKIRARKGYPGK